MILKQKCFKYMFLKVGPNKLCEAGIEVPGIMEIDHIVPAVSAKSTGQTKYYDRR